MTTYIVQIRMMTVINFKLYINACILIMKTFTNSWKGVKISLKLMSSVYAKIHIFGKINKSIKQMGQPYSYVFVLS